MKLRTISVLVGLIFVNASCKSMSDPSSDSTELQGSEGCSNGLHIKDFSKWKNEKFDQNILQESFGCLLRGQGKIARPENISIDSTGSLSFKMEKGKVASSKLGSGGQLELPIRASQEYTFSYQVFFDGQGQAYDWTDGGKLPGLAGGKPYYGGIRANAGDGFSARFMFASIGKIYAYLYHADMKTEHGDPQGIDHPGVLKDKKWNKVKVYYKINNGKSADGVLRLSINDVQLTNRKDLRYRTDSGPIDVLLFSVFHGGVGPRFEPKQTQFIRFKDIQIVPKEI